MCEGANLVGQSNKIELFYPQRFLGRKKCGSMGVGFEHTSVEFQCLQGEDSACVCKKTT